MTHREPCAARPCLRPGVETVAQVTLCEHHMSLMRQELTEVVEVKIKEPRPIPNHWVYYATNGGDWIKIGTTMDLHKRMAQLSTMRDRWKVLAVEPGSYDQEKRRHRQFKEMRRPGTELFRVNDVLLEHVETVRAEFAYLQTAR